MRSVVSCAPRRMCGIILLKGGLYEIDALKRFTDATMHWILMELATDEAGSLDRR